MLEILRLIHITCATFSISGFIIRGVGMLLDANWLHSKVARVLPHIVDTLLLLSAIGMLSIYGLALITQGWLIAKFVALGCYIVCGSIALKRSKTKNIRAAAFLLAVIIFAYIVAVAHSKSPWVFK